MKITIEHYQALCENFKQTRHLMSEPDCEQMRLNLNEMRMQLAFQACVKEWNEGSTINCKDFLIISEKVGIEIGESVYNWVMADIIEVGQNSYSCIGKIHKTKEKTLKKLCEQLTEKLIDLSF